MWWNFIKHDIDVYINIYLYINNIYYKYKNIILHKHVYLYMLWSANYMSIFDHLAILTKMFASINDILSFWEALKRWPEPKKLTINCIYNILMDENDLKQH